VNRPKCLASDTLFHIDSILCFKCFFSRTRWGFLLILNKVEHLKMPWVSFSCDNLQWDLHQLTRNRWNLVLFKTLDLVQCLCESQDCFFIFLKWVLVKVEPWCSTLGMTLLFQTKVGWKPRFLTFQMSIESA
jgi:hypothetical protein